MRKNLFLAGILFSLVGVAWLIEKESSNGTALDREVVGTQMASFTLSEVVEIELPNSKIVKKGQGFFVGDLDYPINQSKLEALVKKLNALRSIKTLKVSSEELPQFFDHQDHLVKVKTFNNEWKFRIGDVSELTGSFYLQSFENSEARLSLVKDASLFEGFYQNELEADLRKYLSLKDLVSSNPFDLIEKRIFTSNDNIKKIKIDNRRNRWFELDLVTNTSTPPAPKGVQLLPIQDVLKEKLKNVTFNKFIKGSKSSLENVISTVEIVNDKDSIFVTLYGLMNGKEGLFLLKSNQEDRVYILDKGQRLFFENVQTFWDKKLDLSGHDFGTLSSFDFELGQEKGQLHAFIVDDIKKFSIKSRSKKLQINDLSYFNLLFNIIFANNGFEQADVIVPLTKKEKSSLIKKLKHKMWMKVLDRTLVFAKDFDSLIMVDVTNNLQYVYYDNTEVEELKDELFFAFK